MKAKENEAKREVNNTSMGSGRGNKIGNTLISDERRTKLLKMTNLGKSFLTEDEKEFIKAEKIRDILVRPPAKRTTEEFNELSDLISKVKFF